MTAFTLSFKNRNDGFGDGTARLSHRDSRVSGFVPEDNEVVSLAPGSNDFRFSIPVEVGDFQVFHGDLLSA